MHWKAFGRTYLISGSCFKGSFQDEGNQAVSENWRLRNQRRVLIAKISSPSFSCMPKSWFDIQTFPDTSLSIWESHRNCRVTGKVFRSFLWQWSLSCLNLSVNVSSKHDLTVKQSCMFSLCAKVSKCDNYIAWSFAPKIMDQNWVWISVSSKSFWACTFGITHYQHPVTCNIWQPMILKIESCSAVVFNFITKNYLGMQPFMFCFVFKEHTVFPWIISVSWLSVSWLISICLLIDYLPPFGGNILSPHSLHLPGGWCWSGVRSSKTEWWLEL